MVDSRPLRSNFSQLKIQPGVTNNKLNKYLSYVVDDKMRCSWAKYTRLQQAGRFAAAGKPFRWYKVAWLLVLAYYDTT